MFLGRSCGTRDLQIRAVYLQRRVPTKGLLAAPDQDSVHMALELEGVDLGTPTALV